MRIKITAVLLCILICAASLCGCGAIGRLRPAGSDYAWALQDTENYYNGLFGDNEIIKVDVSISEENWKDLCEHASEENYYPADVTVNGVKLENVGFRTKGFSSLSMVAKSDSDRYGFKIKTNEYVKGQTLNGLDMFVLNGSFSDASYMREYLTYAACEHLGTITPILSYTDLYINGELFGFYVMIEAYDDSFVERNTDDGDAVLYKASSENCTLTASDNCAGFDVKVGKDEDCTNVKKLIQALDKTKEGETEEIESILDVDSALKAWAVNTVLGNYDSYSGSKAHNYYLLYSDGKFSYIGWDYNMSVGGFSGDNGASVSADVSSGLYGSSPDQRPLISKLLAVEEYYERYIGYVNDLCAYFSDIEGMVNWISDKISEHVKNDPTSFYTYEQYQQNISKSDSNLSGGSFGNFGGQGGQMPQMPGGQGGQGRQMPQMPGGQGGQGGQMPQMPGGQGGQMPQIPGGQGGQGGQMPQMPGGQGGQMPQIPGGQGGQTPSDGLDPGQGGFQLPEGFDPGSIPQGGFSGQLPEGFDPDSTPGMGFGPGGGSLMSSTTCSVVDYITQRINNIKDQLNK
ncbi:MAG: CotH kinase family protein [Clostridia bacterium]|nr:CotH kinase family protein [Clostridia bacterium]